MGYELISYVSSKAIVWPSAEIGDNCLIMEGNIIQPYARVGNDVVMWSGALHDQAVVADLCGWPDNSLSSHN